MKELKELIKNEIEYLESGAEGETMTTEKVANIFRDLLENIG